MHCLFREAFEKMLERQGWGHYLVWADNGGEDVEEFIGRIGDYYPNKKIDTLVFFSQLADSIDRGYLKITGTQGEDISSEFLFSKNKGKFLRDNRACIDVNEDVSINEFYCSSKECKELKSYFHSKVKLKDKYKNAEELIKAYENFLTDGYDVNIRVFCLTKEELTAELRKEGFEVYRNIFSQEEFREVCDEAHGCMKSGHHHEIPELYRSISFMTRANWDSDDDNYTRRNLRKMSPDFSKEYEKEYHEYLDSPHWQLFRKYVIDLIGRKCECCGSESESKYHVHHHRYEDKYGIDIKGRESIEDVAVVCERCHTMIHYKGGIKLKANKLNYKDYTKRFQEVKGYNKARQSSFSLKRDFE